MSAPDGESKLPRYPSHRVSSSTSSLASRGGRREGHAVIDVQDVHRVLECSQTGRQLRFQHLVRCYLSQILYGCTSAYCATPTCFSCNKRNASRPYRPPTQLTARALAYFLASQDNPRRGLCPHELKVAPSTFELDTRGGAQGINREYNVYPSIWNLARQHGQADTADSAAGGDMGQLMERQSTIEALVKRRQTKKDTKSLAQNLHDSVTMIHSFFKQIPDPSSVLALLRSSTMTIRHAAATRLEHSASIPLDVSAQKGKQDTEPALQPKEDPITPQTPVPARIVRQHSQQDLRARSKSHAEHSPPKILDDGQQIHRIPYHPAVSSNQSNISKTPQAMTLDGTSETTRPSARKDKSKNMFGAQASPAMRQTKMPATVAFSEKNEMHAPDQAEPILPVHPKLNCDILEELKEDVYHHRKYQPVDSDFLVDYDTNGRFRPTKPLVNRSLFYTLSDIDTLLKSFHEPNEAFSDSPLPHLDSSRLTNAFRDWSQRNGTLIFDSLWIAMEALFIPPPEIDVQKSPRLRPSQESIPLNKGGEDHKAATAPRYLNAHEAAHIVMVCIHALTSSVPSGWPHTWAQLRKLRSCGVIVPNVVPGIDEFAHPFIDIIDALEYEPALRLANRLLRGIGTRTCFEHILASLKSDHERQDPRRVSDNSLIDVVIRQLAVVERVALEGKRKLKSDHSNADDPGWTVTATLLEWLRTITVKKWDGKAEITKWSSVGTAVMFMDKLHVQAEHLNLQPNMFEMPFFNERLDTVDEPLTFLDWEEQPNTLHILQYPNLFTAQHLVAYFRTINFSRMMGQYDHTTRVHQLQRAFDNVLREPYWWVLKHRMKVTLREYLILDVSRENPLKDTLDQLWGQEKRMLLKPLKVKIGQHEGEVGQDHGGVTYEFFRVVLSETFKPDNGMFTIDPQMRMTWFQVRPLEPLWKFEMLGILFSLAVYNGITLPVTFPLAFYHFLLTPEDSHGKRDKLSALGSIEHIRDGWPSLAKAFAHLLSWTDGDVGEVIMRDYAFSYEAYGQKIDHNMAYPMPPATESSIAQDDPPLVTNANRAAFVRDYIHFLTYASIAPQLHAFSRGFLTCIHPKSLSLFTPLSLRNLIEGSQHISIPSLRRIAKYEDGYTATHATIRDFWAVLESYDQQDARRLLEFVTASDRVPVTGYESITFHVVRVGGGESGVLPTSSTCFGKLYLPEYVDGEVMRRKLGVAMGYSRGFGVA